MTGPRALLALGLSFAAFAATPSAANMLREDPLPRVEDALCPGVIGMKTDTALQLLDRVRYNAQRLGIRLDDPETCSPNLLIAFVDSGQDSVAALMRSQPRLFETMSTPDRRALTTSDKPVRAFSYVATRTRDGMWVPPQENLVQIPRATMWNAHSKIYSPIRQDILSTVVIFDAKKVGGLTTTQLADYASMRSLAVDFSAVPDMRESILGLFDADANRPSELTATDLEFLKSLYSGIPNLPASAKNRSIERKFEEDGGT